MLERRSERDQSIGDEQRDLPRHRGHVRHDGPRVGEGELLLELEGPIGPRLVGEEHVSDLADQLIRMRQGRGHTELVIGQPVVNRGLHDRILCGVRMWRRGRRRTLEVADSTLPVKSSD